MDAIELLMIQHEEAKALFKKIERAEDDEKQDLFERVADALAVLATIEEKQFYPATRNARTEEMLQEAVEEHLAAKRLIADLLEMTPDDPQFDAKIAVLKEQVEHHIEEEEAELFPKVRRMFKADELEDLGVAMEDMAEDLKAEGAPRESVPAETGSAAPLE
ncbi:MAG: hemerythrin domain-containing protein [Deltaproteobacteria bacterium]|nr:MAG: hemerythrin domain-containing protein [Deltaproteobacteria bacterium]